MKNLEDIKQQIRRMLLADRIERATEMVEKMCSERRPPKISIPVQPTDEDVFITTTLEDVAGLFSLIYDLTDTEPCWFDHHGHCQAHGWMVAEPACPHRRAKEILK